MQCLPVNGSSAALTFLVLPYWSLLKTDAQQTE